MRTAMLMVARVHWVAWLLALACAATGPETYDNGYEEEWDGPTHVVDPPKPVEQRAWGQRTAGEPLADVAYTDPGDLPELRAAGGEKLPLRHTHVDAKLSGFVAEVEVTQTFENDFSKPIEAVYVFPLPENSAVGDMKIVIGDRVIQAEIKRREEARAIYTDAKRKGHTAALLEQERPNVFTQSVANIEPGKDIDVVIRYTQTLTYDAGSYEFVFPMVVGPRFIQGQPVDRAQRGAGTKADTNLVPDASRITPPVVGKGMRSGHDISLELVADAGMPIVSHEVPTHVVETKAQPGGALAVKLGERKSIPNRDFVMRYRVADAKPQAALLTEGDDKAGHFSLVIQPPELDVDALVGRREMIFVVDVSGSMSGFPIGMCRDAMRLALAKLRPVDTFNVLTFAGATNKAFANPVPANQANLSRALQVVNGMQAGGGTFLADAVDAALRDDVAEGHNRYVFFLTDGYVGIENEVFSLASRLVRRLAKRKQSARVLTFGVGSSVNRELIAKLAGAGNGVAVYATAREAPDRAVNTFFRYVDRPVIGELEIDWQGMTVEDVYPTRLPDVFASHPVIVHGRYKGKPAVDVVVRGKAGKRKVKISAATKRSPANALASLWARARIEDLSRNLWERHDAATVEAIAKVGLEHRLVTAYTSFVAVDRSRKVGDGEPEIIVQPVETPEGVDAVMAGATIAGQGVVLQGASVSVSYGMAATSATSRDYAQVVAVQRYAPGTGGMDPVPVVRLGRITGTSGKDKRTIRRALRSARRSLRKCYDSHPEPRSAGQRRIVVELTLAATGAIVAVRSQRSTLDDKTTEACVLAAVRRVDVGTLSARTTLRLPVVFRMSH